MPPDGFLHDKRLQLLTESVISYALTAFIGLNTGQEN